MIIDDDQEIRAEVLPLEIMWRNSPPLVRAHLRANEKSYAYYGCAEQAKNNCARHANWDDNQC
jgi:hypothetical protein